MYIGSTSLGRTSLGLFSNLFLSTSHRIGPTSFLSRKLFSQEKKDILHKIHLLKSGFKKIDIQQDDRPTPLQVAVKSKDLTKVKWLLNSGENVNERGCLGQPPLFAAVKTRNLAMVKFLVEAGAKPELMETKNWYYHFNAGHYSLILGCYEITRYLVNTGKFSLNVNVHSFDYGIPPSNLDLVFSANFKNWTPYQFKEKENLILFILRRQECLKTSSEKNFFQQLVNAKMVRVIDHVLDRNLLNFKAIEKEMKISWLQEAKKHKWSRLEAVLLKSINA